jgi:NADP-dependent 3-hydroxy acid dehydrogenase YdfG
MDIEKSTILITGASSGIGLATASTAIELGARVALIARRADRLSEIATRLGPDAMPVACDVTPPRSHAACKRSLIRSAGSTSW